MRKKELTHERLKEVLDYDKSTGFFVWKVKTAKVVVIGTRAGSYKKKPKEITGYRYIFVDGRRYSEHRLAFYWMTGRWPKKEIDHVNLNGADNAWINLREATHSQNIANCRTNARNTSGVKGVRRENGKYAAFIGVNGRLKRLGSFQSIYDAAAAYEAAAKEHHGEFARVK